MNNQWCVLQVMTGEEDNVAMTLAARNICFALVPRRRLFERHRGKWQYVTRPTFPGYVFVLNVTTPETYYAILAAPNVLRFLGAGTGAMPKTVPEEQMVAILMLEGNDIPPERIRSIDKRRRRMTVALDVLDETKLVTVAYDTTSNPE